MSHSSRSSTNQSAFRFRVAVRDFSCLLTGDPAEECVAAHIIPQSRPEYYTEIVGREVTYPFLTEHGITLNHAMHRAYDNGDFALWPRGEDLIVHYFMPKMLKRRAHHGQVIHRSHFRVQDESELPNKQLLMFHYQQCVIKYLRGFAAGFESGGGEAQVGGASGGEGSERLEE
ncbi:hypothetical protein IE81DRAFT_325947 [Ceraceosorus guamensis]|uniref:HNH nuclease domain-containing protein n=1 Tax=Ceraceosorus guamensis TaxID=1522189 RepID=A0A316VQY0_9BASI|nr:hypothetical protein IE81DRAFT_325947 [Ceraceosorus guamensis]PWN40017.1 hypothetical protein IE81DRAFT_325947 [Ceraceosorus guamensis]